MKKVTEITSFEDACKNLGLNPKNLPVVHHLPEKDQKSLIAYYKLVIIIRALNEGWEPDFKNFDQDKYFNYLYISSAGFVYVHTNYGPSNAFAFIGSRLCLKNRELAVYASDKFLDLYKDYLLNY